VIPSYGFGSGFASPSNRLDNLRNSGKISKTALQHQPARKKHFEQNQKRPTGCYFFLILIVRLQESNET
jgi:hypothetical protein